jgi:hypothetical protein
MLHIREETSVSWVWSTLIYGRRNLIFFLNERSRQVEFSKAKAGPRGVTTLAQGGKNPRKNAFFRKIRVWRSMARRQMAATDRGSYLGWPMVGRVYARNGIIRIDQLNFLWAKYRDHFWKNCINPTLRSNCAETVSRSATNSKAKNKHQFSLHRTVKTAAFYVKGLILKKIFFVWGVIPKNDIEMRSSRDCADAIGPSQLGQKQ